MAGKSETAKSKLGERVQLGLVGDFYWIRTEQADVHWVRRFIVFHGKRHRSTWERQKSGFPLVLATERDMPATTPVSTTMVYTQVLNRARVAVRSPLD